MRSININTTRAAWTHRSACSCSTDEISSCSKSRETSVCSFDSFRPGVKFLDVDHFLGLFIIQASEKPKRFKTESSQLNPQNFNCWTFGDTDTPDWQSDLCECLWSWWFCVPHLQLLIRRLILFAHQIQTFASCWCGELLPHSQALSCCLCIVFKCSFLL